MNNKRIISCAITGSIHCPSMSPYFPFKPEDIAQHAIDAANAGASSVHIHARNPENGAPSTDLNIFDDIINRIRTVNKDVIICVTTGGGVGMTIEQRAAVIPLFKPELASMNAGSINYGLFPIAKKFENIFKYDWEKPMYESTKDYVFRNTFAEMEYMLNTMSSNGTKPELECYDVGHIYNVKYMVDNGLLKGKPYLQFVLGINGALGAAPEDLVMMKETADRLLGIGNYEWSAFGAGKNEFPICTQNLLLGGHVRVGMEDNLNISRGVFAKSNAELVEKMVRIMDDFGFEPASPTEARVMLGL